MSFLYPDEVATVRARAKARDVPGLADALVHVADINDGHWGYDGRRVTDAVDALDESVKHELVAALIERASGITEPGPPSSAGSWRCAETCARTGSTSARATS